MSVQARLPVDLHCHSIYSDGVLSPAELAARAHANGVQLWALTDHD
ncbi:PHP domain-containing protein, partial [Alcaligenes pakistanensis]